MNGQDESTNKMIVNTLRNWLEHAKVRWADELSGVLWSYRTTAKTSTWATPFSLVYESEAVVLVKISIPNTRYQFTTEEQNNEMLSFELDTIDEKCKAAATQINSYKQQAARYCNTNARTRIFQVGD